MNCNNATKTPRTNLLVNTLFCCLCLSACVATPENQSHSPLSNVALLPEPDLVISVPFLSNCTGSDDQTLHLSSNEPVIIIVHGCFSSAGRFRSLADVFAFHGQQAVCFNYDDRERLAESSADLITAIEGVAKALQQPAITVIGHSQGGLIARRALVEERQDRLDANNMDIGLVTISAPFGGISSAQHCGSRPLAWFSLGITKLICQVVTGSKYHEIPPNSEFITRPGNLIPLVNKHLKISTDEVDSCRRFNDQGKCVEDDFVFSLQEQSQQAIVQDADLASVVVKSGHVEIIGNGQTTPVKLIEVLQQNGLLNTTPSEKEIELTQLLTRLYLDPFAE
jgi:Serine aminopeptidase, S33